MNLEQQVTSLNLSKRLKELGVKQLALFWWSEHTIPATLWNEHDLGENDPYAGVSDKSVAAFTVAELGELLPSRLTNNLVGEHQQHQFMCEKWPNEKWNSAYVCLDCKGNMCRVQEERMAESMGLMLVYLIEDKLLNV